MSNLVREQFEQVSTNKKKWKSVYNPTNQNLDLEQIKQRLPGG